MAFDALSAVIGAFAVILVFLIFRFFSGKRSFYSALPDFQINMSPEEAKALYDATFKSISDEYDMKLKETLATDSPEKHVALMKEGRDILGEFSDKYENFIMMKQKAMPQQEINMESPSPAPEAPVSEAPTPAPQTSTYEIEPYHA